MLNLKVQVASEPIVKHRLLHVTRGMDLQLQPRFAAVVIDVHGNMVGLRHPREPVTLDQAESEPRTS